MPTAAKARKIKLGIAGGAFALAVVLVLRLLLFRGGDERKHFDREYYFDIDANKLYIVPTGEDPPRAAPSGGEAVRAHVYSCGDCDDEAKRFIGFLDKYSDEGKQMRQDPHTTFHMLLPHHFIARHEDPKTWHVEGSEEARQIRSDIAQRCPNERTTCYPP